MIIQKQAQFRGVNLLAQGSVVAIELSIIEASIDPTKEAWFFPQFSYAVLRSKVGPAVTTTARIRMGGNGTHDNVMPLFTIAAGAAVGGYSMPPFVAEPYVPHDLRTGPIYFEVERGAIGPTELTGDIMIVGTMVSG